MDFKVGDIVNMSGHSQRVTDIGQRFVTLSHSGSFDKKDFKRYINMFKNSNIVEPITLPQLKVGDLVFVRDIPNEEKSRYGLMWWPEKNNYIGKIWPITHIQYNEFCVPIVTLDDSQLFYVYHLEKIDDYDIV